MHSKCGAYDSVGEGREGRGGGREGGREGGGRGKEMFLVE